MARKTCGTTSDSSPPDDIAIAIGNIAGKSAMSGEKRKAEPIGRTTKRAKEVSRGRSRAMAVRTHATTSSQLEQNTAEESTTGDDTPENKTQAEIDQNTRAPVQKKGARQTKKAKNIEPLQKRTKHAKLRIGAHVSSAGGVHNALVNLVQIGGNAFALFLKNQRKWESPDLSPEHTKLFIEGSKEHDIDVAECCVPHGSYLVNLAHPDPERKKQAYSSFLNDLTRCHKLGIRLYNFHPGNANATSHEEGIRLIAESINQAHQDEATGNVVALLETMASLGNTVGGTFADIGAIIALVRDKSRVGVCLDTCHVFAAGYDLRTPEAYEATMEKFDRDIGLKYLKAFHINDSKAPLGSHRDLHANIGTGYLGLRAFHSLVNDERFVNVPMILETPVSAVSEDGKKIEDKGTWAREIKLLERLLGMDVETNDFQELEIKLQKEGKLERERIGSQVERSKTKKAVQKRKAQEQTGDKHEHSSDQE